MNADVEFRVDVSVDEWMHGGFLDRFVDGDESML